jgi:hypothetical protein
VLAIPTNTSLAEADVCHSSRLYSTWFLPASMKSISSSSTSSMGRFALLVWELTLQDFAQACGAHAQARWLKLVLFIVLILFLRRLQSLPQHAVRDVRSRHLQAVDLHPREVAQLAGVPLCLERADDLLDDGRLARARQAADVDGTARALLGLGSSGSTAQDKPSLILLARFNAG